MRVKQESFLDILGVPQMQFVVPVYQRVYSWSARQCDTLMDDVAEAVRTGQSHFTGVLLFALDTDVWGECGRLHVVDGQQRLTTVTLMLVAFAEGLRDGRWTVEGLTAQDVLTRYLVTGEEPGAPCKLVLSHLDRGTLAGLVDQLSAAGAGAAGTSDDADDAVGLEYSARLLENLDLFRERMARADFDAESFWRGLGAMQIISALLEGNDSPQDAYESLNSKGSPLTAADLVRNALLFASDEEGRRERYEQLWRPIEQSVRPIKGADMDSLIRAWLASRFRTFRVRNEAEAYAVLKDHLIAREGTIEDMMASLVRFGQRYVSDATWRSDMDRQAKDWLADKPRGLVSEHRMFGD